MAWPLVPASLGKITVASIVHIDNRGYAVPMFHHRHRHWYRRRIPAWVAAAMYAFMLCIIVAAVITAH